ncbi:bifunctional metallophosphatase/5'-nucleotidase [Myxococcota bacterium]
MDKMRYWHFIAVAVVVLAGSPVAAAEKKEIVVLFTTDLYGRFSEVACGQAEPAGDFAKLVSAVGVVREGLTKAGRPLPLVLNGGDNIGPHAFGRFVLSKGKPGAEMLAGWLRAADYELVALGNQDFYAAPDRLRAYLEAGMEAGLKFSAANLDCESKEAGLCPFIGAGPKRYRMFERGGLKIAVFSLVHGELAEDVPPANLKGIRVVDPFKRAQEVEEVAREDGADLVFVLSHLDHSETSPRKALQLARSLPGADLIVANGFTSQEGERGIGVIRFTDGATPIVGSDLFGQHLGRADLVVVRQGDRWRIESVESAELDPSTMTPEPVVREELADLRKSYCADWDKPVCQGKLTKPMSAADFEQYLMEIMRHTTRSELVFINRGLVNPRTVFPIEGAITRHDFFSGLPHRNQVYTFKLNVEEITKLCAAMAQEKGATGDVRLLHRGLSCGDVIKVNGRALESGESYTAVTIEYLATGMLGYFKDQKKKMVLYQPDPEKDAPVVGSMARGFLSGPRFSGAEPIDLEANFVDLADRLRWTFSGMLNFSLADTSINNGPAYGESQLTRDEFIAMKFEVRGKMGASSSFHAFYAELLTKYAKSSINAADFVESEDLTTFNLLYKLNALRSAKSGWYVPALYVEGQAETELTKPDERDFHHLELTGTLGARFTLLPTLEAKIGAGVRHEVLDENADPVCGVDLGYELVRTDLFTLMGSPFQFESKFSAFFGDIGRTNTLKGTWTNRVYFALVGPIFFTVTHDLFFYRYSSWDYGLASDLTIGLSYSARTSVQTF